MPSSTGPASSLSVPDLLPPLPCPQELRRSCACNHSLAADKAPRMVPAPVPLPLHRTVLGVPLDFHSCQPQVSPHLGAASVTETLPSWLGSQPPGGAPHNRDHPPRALSSQSQIFVGTSDPLTLETPAEPGPWRLLRAYGVFSGEPGLPVSQAAQSKSAPDMCRCLAAHVRGNGSSRPAGPPSSLRLKCGPLW